MASKVFGMNGLRPEKVRKARTDVTPINDVAKGGGNWKGVSGIVREKETGKAHMKIGGGKVHESKIRPR